jgi:hypothetical protein
MADDAERAAKAARAKAMVSPNVKFISHAAAELGGWSSIAQKAAAAESWYFSFAIISFWCK